MFRKKYIILGLAMVMLLASTMPASAVSNITNTLTANDYSISTGQTINFTAKTVYGWSVMWNPYTSNFVSEMSAYHFNLPISTVESGVAGNWVYKNPGYHVSPAYRYVGGYWLINPTVTKYHNFYSKAKSALAGSQRKSRHGQAIEQNWDISYGSPAWITTTHN